MLKEKLKTKRGITLIALVITIIVMLILVAATVTVALNGGLFKSAKKATADTENARVAESELSSGRVQINNIWYDSIEDYINGIKSKDQADEVTGAEAWTEEKDESGNITIKRGGQTLNIGDYVNYTTDNDNSSSTKWRVLGVEKGRLLLMADANVGSTVQLEGSDWGEDGQPLVDQLNKECQKYLNTNYAESIRSIKVEDVNNITGYNPLCEGIKNPTDEQIKSGSKYGKDQTYEYGNKVKYTWSNNGAKKVIYDDKEAGGNGKHVNLTSSETKFIIPPDSKELGGEGLTVESTYYYYYPHTLSTDSSTSSDVKGISTTSPAYKMIFENSSGAKESYWLASPCVSAGTGRVRWSLRFVTSSGRVNYYYVWTSYIGSSSTSFGVRPVVSLKSDVKLTKNNSGTQNESVTYTIDN